ncbi:MAG: uroporphyrinogen-III C-methyltransferase [Acidobacteriota bacterium]|nr:MAG: uroporphyrinogen-III C-methyltransferase [Acidobacteriota bacterium]
MYPVMLNLENRSCLVVGGGGVALRKVEGLLTEGARITVIAPEPVARLEELEQEGAIRLERRAYREGELRGYALGFAATNDRRVNRQVFWEGENLGIWVNVADDPDICSFHLPARLKRGALQIAIASAGEAPFVVRRIRRMLEKALGPEWSEWIQAAAGFRQKIKKSNLSPAEQQRCFDRFFDSTVDEQRLAVRVPNPTEEATWLDPLRACNCCDTPSGEPVLRERNGKGWVALVGAGPGDAGLLTLKGYRRLLAADAIVYDHLAETVLPLELRPEVELHPVGKKAGYHPVPQSEINALLIRLASGGKRVVRLKGGDPYVFGRGGEEAEALVNAGIDFEVVPCVTAATAVSAYAGIPVTYREESVRLTLVTAHECRKLGGKQSRWDLIARDEHATLVGYMGVTSLPSVVKRLIEEGMDAQTPAAVIERGTTSRQRSVRSPLCELPQRAAEAGICPPAIFAIGPSVARAEHLDWFTRKPLFGTRIVLGSSAKNFARELEESGAEVLALGQRLTPASEVVLRALPVSDLLFGSPDEVDTLEELRGSPAAEGIEAAWCIGVQTAERARELGWSGVIELAGDIDSATLVNSLIRHKTAVVMPQELKIQGR